MWDLWIGTEFPSRARTAVEKLRKNHADTIKNDTKTTQLRLLRKLCFMGKQSLFYEFNYPYAVYIKLLQFKVKKKLHLKKQLKFSKQNILRLMLINTTQY